MPDADSLPDRQAFRARITGNINRAIAERDPTAGAARDVAGIATQTPFTPCNAPGLITPPARRGVGN